MTRPGKLKSLSGSHNAFISGSVPYWRYDPNPVFDWTSDISETVGSRLLGDRFEEWNDRNLLGEIFYGTTNC